MMLKKLITKKERTVMIKSLSKGFIATIIAAISMLVVNGCVQKKVDVSKPAAYVGAEKCKECHEKLYAG